MRSPLNCLFHHNPATFLTGLFVVLLLSGCATFSADGGFSPVQEAATLRLKKQLIWQRTANEQTLVAQQIKALLDHPLTVEDAVQIALLNNPDLQASFESLGIAEADFVSASRLSNPGFSFGRTKQGETIEKDSSVTFNVLQLLTLPISRHIEKRRFEQTQQAVTSQMLSLAEQTRKAYYQALAAEQIVTYTKQVKEAASASAELAKRMLKAGNFSALTQMEQQDLYIEALVAATRALQMASQSREQLTQLMGLRDDAIHYRLPKRLPDLPPTLPPLTSAEQRAVDQRLDIQSAKLHTEQLAKQLGLTRATRWINVLEFGALRTTASNEPLKHGYEISLELPLFDFGQTKVVKAEAIYRQALHKTESIAVRALSDVRETYLRYQQTYDIAKHYQHEVMPLKKRILDENQLRYNGMLIDVFQLLQSAQDQIASVNKTIEATRDFWLAQADLEAALWGVNLVTSESIVTSN